MEKAEKKLISFKHRSEGLLALRPTDGLPLKLKAEIWQTALGCILLSIPCLLFNLPKGTNGTMALTELPPSCLSGLGDKSWALLPSLLPGQFSVDRIDRDPEETLHAGCRRKDD